jgi:hypothetical protein
MYVKRTKTSETFISPEQFDDYTRRGYVIFMTKPTAFGTYKAIKVEMITEEQIEVPITYTSTESTVRNFKPRVGFWNFMFRA